MSKVYEARIDVVVTVLALVYADDEESAKEKAKDEFTEVDYTHKINIAGLPSSMKLIKGYDCQAVDADLATD
jgi:hypothetical protein